jgi:hypothetical protein
VSEELTPTQVSALRVLCECGEILSGGEFGEQTLQALASRGHCQVERRVIRHGSKVYRKWWARPSGVSSRSPADVGGGGPPEDVLHHSRGVAAVAGAATYGSLWRSAAVV